MSAYVAHTWSTGDVISATLLNHLETQAASITGGFTATGVIAAEAGVEITASGGGHAFTFAYNQQTGSLDLQWN